MSKRKLAQSSSKHLNHYKKSYKGGGKKDSHYAIFQDALRIIVADDKSTTIEKVLYPGCHRHLTAALIFPQVTFVDMDPKVAPLYVEAAATEYVETHKIYESPQQQNYQFYCCSVNDKKKMSNLIGDNKYYDTLISLSAGAMAEPCSKFVRGGGFLLVNDAHSDARTVFCNDNAWTLFAYYENGAFTTERLDRCFRVIVPNSSETTPLSIQQARESVAVGTISKRSFKLLFEPMFFLFKKKK